MDDPTAYQAESVLCLSPEARFDYLLTLPESADTGAQVNAVMRDIEQHNPTLSAASHPQHPASAANLGVIPV